MKKNDFVQYWIQSSDIDFSAMINLFKSKDYHWSLFIGHLVLEKLLKAYFIKTNDEKDEIFEHPPRSHDLLYIAEKTNLKMNDQQKDLLDLITTFNISARYPDYKNSFFKKCTKEYTNKRIEEIKELRKWLKSAIEN